MSCAIQLNMQHCNSKLSKWRRYYKTQHARWIRHLPIQEDDRGGLNSIPRKYKGWLY